MRINAPWVFLGVFLLSCIGAQKNAPPLFFPVFFHSQHDRHVRIHALCWLCEDRSKWLTRGKREGGADEKRVAARRRTDQNQSSIRCAATSLQSGLRGALRLVLERPSCFVGVNCRPFR